MTRRLRLAARFAGLRRGAHSTRVRMEARLVLALTTGGFVTVCVVLALAIQHIATHEVAR